MSWEAFGPQMAPDLSLSVPRLGTDKAVSHPVQLLIRCRFVVPCRFQKVGTDPYCKGSTSPKATTPHFLSPCIYPMLHCILAGASLSVA